MNVEDQSIVKFHLLNMNLHSYLSIWKPKLNLVILRANVWILDTIQPPTISKI